MLCISMNCICGCIKLRSPSFAVYTLCLFLGLVSRNLLLYQRDIQKSSAAAHIGNRVCGPNDSSINGHIRGNATSALLSTNCQKSLRCSASSSFSGLHCPPHPFWLAGIEIFFEPISTLQAGPILGPYWAPFLRPHLQWPRAPTCI